MTVNDKQRLLLNECRYKLHHFCDGTPNKSIEHDDKHKQYPPCPDFKNCELRRIKVLETSKEDKR